MAIVNMPHACKKNFEINATSIEISPSTRIKLTFALEHKFAPSLKT